MKKNQKNQEAVGTSIPENQEQRVETQPDRSPDEQSAASEAMQARDTTPVEQHEEQVEVEDSGQENPTSNDELEMVEIKQSDEDEHLTIPEVLPVLPLKSVCVCN